LPSTTPTTLRTRIPAVFGRPASAHKELGGVIGNSDRQQNHNLLTQFINVETLSFQSMLQAGRWQMHSIATLPGTNFVMWTSLIRQLNGWDEEALTGIPN